MRKYRYPSKEASVSSKPGPLQIDLAKALLCAEHGIRLIVVPPRTTMTPESIENLMREEPEVEEETKVAEVELY